MRSVCFFVNGLTLKSGIVRVVYNIISELVKTTDLKLSVICMYTDMDCKEITDLAVELYSLDLKKYPKKLRYFKMVKGIRNFIKKKEWDAVVISGMEFALFFWIACLGIDKTKLIAWEHRNFYAGPKLRLEWIGKRLACKKFDGIICITKKDHSFYRAYKRNDDKLFQIYNLVKFKDEYKPDTPQNYKIVSCGSLSYVKGFDMLIAIAAEILPKHKDWIWDIYGEGDEYPKLMQLIHKYNLEDCVFLRGYEPNICELYKNYSIFAFTSRMEGMPSVLVEAQKAGLPIVSFDILCGPSDVVIHGKNGYLIPPYDLKKMGEKIELLMESKSIRYSFSMNSRMMHHEFEKKFSLKKWYGLLGYEDTKYDE